MTNDELFDLIRSAYLRGYSWAKENGFDETALFAVKAAYDYADKTTSARETTPTPSTEITDEMVERMARWLCSQFGLEPDFVDEADEEENWRCFRNEAASALIASLNNKA